MKSISAAEANRQFSRLLGEVKGGKTITITSRGSPVAYIGPVGSPRSDEDAQRSRAEAERRATASSKLWDRLDRQSAMNLGKFNRDDAYD